MTGREILEEAFKWKECVYWYGGKGQKCTESLLQTLATQNPNTYTRTYIEKARKDIAAGKTCIDCSGLVCKAYKYPMLGSYQLEEKLEHINAEQALPGMVLWKPGHVALVLDDRYILEAKGIDFDIIISKRNNSAFKCGLFDKYNEYQKTYEKGWHKDAEGLWYAWGEFKGCYYHDIYQVIDGVGYYFNSGGYVV